MYICKKNIYIYIHIYICIHTYIYQHHDEDIQRFRIWSNARLHFDSRRGLRLWLLVHQGVFGVRRPLSTALAKLGSVSSGPPLTAIWKICHCKSFPKAQGPLSKKLSAMGFLQQPLVGSLGRRVEATTATSLSLLD